MQPFGKARKFGMTLLAVMLTSFIGASVAVAQEQERDRSHESCDSYDMDVTQDLHLLGLTATPVSMASDAEGELPTITLDEPYEITLHPQSEVAFSVEPSRVMLAEGSYAGFMDISVPTSGRYRFSFSGESWVDMVADGRTLDTTLFAGRHGCNPLRKLVDYDLEAGQNYMLMLSGRSRSSMLMAAREVQE